MLVSVVFLYRAWQRSQRQDLLGLPCSYHHQIGGYKQIAHTSSGMTYNACNPNCLRRDLWITASAPRPLQHPVCASLCSNGLFCSAVSHDDSDGCQQRMSLCAHQHPRYNAHPRVPVAIS